MPSAKTGLSVTIIWGHSSQNDFLVPSQQQFLRFYWSLAVDWWVDNNLKDVLENLRLAHFVIVWLDSRKNGNLWSSTISWDGR